MAGEDSILRKLSTLLQEARPSASALRAAAEATDAIAELIKKIPELQATPGAAQGFVQDLGVDSDKLGFTFMPPEVVQVAGSLAAGTVARPDVATDLLVRLPKVCLVLPMLLLTIL
jgi:U3 small nucleolar RNA-associated protein 22